MDQTQKPLLWSLLAVSACLAGLGLFAMRNEAAATALGSGSTRLPQFIHTISRDVDLPLSVEGRRLLLDVCEMGLQASLPLVLRFASDEQRQMVVPFCRDLAQEAVAASPADSYAWLVLAMAQVQSGEVAAAEQSLEWSALTGATEGWIAQSRFGLIQDHYQDFSEQVRSIGDADALLLLDSSYGGVVARRYVVDIAFRERIKALIEAQPEAIQRRFISLVRRRV